MLHSASQEQHSVEEKVTRERMEEPCSRRQLIVELPSMVIIMMMMRCNKTNRSKLEVSRLYVISKSKQGAPRSHIQGVPKSDFGSFLLRKSRIKRSQVMWKIWPHTTNILVLGVLGFSSILKVSFFHFFGTHCRPAGQRPTRA